MFRKGLTCLVVFAWALALGCSSAPTDDPDLTVSTAGQSGFGQPAGESGGVFGGGGTVGGGIPVTEGGGVGEATSGGAEGGTDGGADGGAEGSTGGGESEGGAEGGTEEGDESSSGEEGAGGDGETGGTGGQEGCIDTDNDGYGSGCFLGEDCDDNNPNYQVDCPDCSGGNVQGCPCLEDGATQICFSGPPQLEGVGACKAGERVCSGGYWTGCIGEVPPSEEVCDYLDNDCDGVQDEGVLSACGNCDKFCELDEFGPGTPDPFDIESEPSESVEKTDEGYVTLSENAFSLHFIWIANSAESTVSKLDTITGKELARYKVCSDPSRTAVDKNGDCWVGCRGDGTVMKITNFIETCADPNGNGIVETSVDINQDGTISTDEMVDNDECIAITTQPVGVDVVRGIGIDNNNYPWIGMWNSMQVVQLHPDTGAVVQSYNVGVNPYGLAVDKNNNVWVAGRGGKKLVKLAPGGTTTSYVPPGNFDPYGITVDLNGDVWIGNCCNGNVAWRFNPGSESWTSVATDARPRGVAAGQDGFLYVANDQDNRIAKIDLNTLQKVATVDLGAGRFPVGIAVDPQGFVWAVNQSSASATKVDPNVDPQTGNMTVILEQPVGAGPYTYSDMTGATFFQDIAPEGFFTETYGGWDEVRVVWESIDIQYNAPPGTYIDFQLRTADTLEELEVAEWTDFLGPFPGNPMPVNLLDVLEKKAKYLQVKVSLFTTSDSIKPFVEGISIQYTALPEDG